MRPLNSKERSKQVWQFIFIFFALAVVPVALIFFSYYKVPEKLSDNEWNKLKAYSQFNRTQKLLSKQLSEIDSNLNLLAGNTSNIDPTVLKINIANQLRSIQEADSGVLVSIMYKTYNNHLNHINALIEAKGNAKDCSELATKLKACEEANMKLKYASSSEPPL